MNLKSLLLSLFVLVGLSTQAQITITSADMPFAGDTFRVSRATLPVNIDVSLTGTNFTWDFSALTPASQSVDSFVSVSSTGIIYSFFFGFGSNAANVAQKGGNFAAIPGFPISDIYSFYNRSTSNFRQVGYGANLSGIGTPMAFGNKDFIYNFPLQFGDADSCNSDYGISLPNLGAYQAYQKRINNVDGWGTVITPYGTFNALRIVSELTGTDSLFLDTLGQGFQVTRPLTREYKWLAAGEGIPVIQINTQVVGPVEQITSIVYKDSLQVTGINSVTAALYQAEIFPNPSAEQAMLKVENTSVGMSVVITDLSGRFVGQHQFNASELKNGIVLDQHFSGLGNAVYLVHLRGNQGTEILRWVRAR